MKIIHASVLAVGIMVTSGAHAEQQASRWISVAGALWKVQGIAHAAVGYSGVKGSESDAKSSALRSCVAAGGSSCKVLATYNSGCMYITSGHSDTKAGFGGGATAEKATSQCEGQGLQCNRPIGGCVE